MPRTPARFTQADIQRVIRAVEAEEFKGSVEFLPDGRIRIISVKMVELPQAANQSAKPLIQL